MARHASMTVLPTRTGGLYQPAALAGNKPVHTGQLMLVTCGMFP